MQEIDINKEPPSREFLEKHIDADHFLDYVSTRSPVWKERPLPKSKKEAIESALHFMELHRQHGFARQMSFAILCGSLQDNLENCHLHEGVNA